MIGLAAVAALLGAWRMLEELGYSTFSYGRNTSVLPIGFEVIVVEGCRWRDLAIVPGEAGVVTADPPDEDSAYPNRLVSVRMDAGPHRGTVVPVRRICLRAR